MSKYAVRRHSLERTCAIPKLARALTLGLPLWLTLSTGIGASAQQPAPQAPGAQPAPAWSTNVEQNQRPQSPPVAASQLALSAQLADDTAVIDAGLIWRVYRAQSEEDGSRRPIHQSREAQPTLRVDPGVYVVVVGYGRANLTRRIAVEPGRTATEKFVLNAGLLRVNAALTSGEAVPERMMSFEVLGDERDQSGQRPKIATGLKPGVAIRLNAGIYHIVSTYGDANAVARADITIEPGRMSEIKITHQAARVTFKLVAREGGEAIPDAQWSIVNVQGEVVKESVGALPTHILAPGLYAVGARLAGVSYRREFTVKSGEAQSVEVTTQMTER